MNIPVTSLEYKGRTLGLVALVTAQVLIGFIHVAFGFWLLVATQTAPFVDIVSTSYCSSIYGIYTMIFGILTLLFAVLLWLQKRWAWIGTLALLVFVVAVDSLTLLDMPSIPGIPKSAGFGRNNIQYPCNDLPVAGSRAGKIRD